MEYFRITFIFRCVLLLLDFWRPFAWSQLVEIPSDKVTDVEEVITPLSATSFSLASQIDHQKTKRGN
jgi:hypothetical protein